MPEELIVVLLGIWVGAVAVLFYANCADGFLWVPAFLVVAGLFSSILPVALSSNVAVVANGTILVLFIVSLEMLTKKRRPAMAFSHAARR